MAASAHSRNKVCYYYDSDIGNYFYGLNHPMQPHRISMTHDLLFNYGLWRKMEIYRPHRATAVEMTKFHTEDYIRFLRSVQPDNQDDYKKQMKRFIDGGEKEKSDNPIFEGLYEFCQISAGGSVAGAAKLNKGGADIAINWAGGLHHAKKSQAAGFCYVNDIVLAILELLKYHQRVLYIDIDIHHGDGVEEAFYTTDRVMTVSFHKYQKDFFPGTGHLKDIGAGKGKYYAVNFPLLGGMDDESYESIFSPIVSKVMEMYQPNAVVLQCGADSLTGDSIGSFNLTLKGHAKCVEFMKKYNLPLLLLGGGGYTIRNVARCWTFETAVALGEEISNELPYNGYFDYFEKSNYKLHISPSNMINQNTPEYLDKVKAVLFEHLRMLPCAPGVQMQEIPEDAMNFEEPEEDESRDNSEERVSIRASDKRVYADNEMSDSEDEGDGRRYQRSYRSRKLFKQEETTNNKNDDSEKKKPTDTSLSAEDEVKEKYLPMDVPNNPTELSENQEKPEIKSEVDENGSKSPVSVVAKAAERPVEADETAMDIDTAVAEQNKESESAASSEANESPSGSALPSANTISTTDNNAPSSTLPSDYVFPTTDNNAPNALKCISS